MILGICLVAIAVGIYLLIRCNKDKKNLKMQAPIVNPLRGGMYKKNCPECVERGTTKYTRREGFLDQYQTNIPTGGNEVVSLGGDLMSSPFVGGAVIDTFSSDGAPILAGVAE